MLHSIVAISIGRILQLYALRSSADPLFDRVAFVALTQTEQAYSLAAAVLPAMKPFLKELDTGFGINPTTTRQPEVDNTTATPHRPGSPANSGWGSEDGILVSREYVVKPEDTCDGHHRRHREHRPWEEH